MSSALDPMKVLEGYCHGAFPMADPDSGQIDLFVCQPRCVLSLEAGGIRVPSSLARRVRSGRFGVTWNQSFREVVAACARERSSENRSWISPELAACYETLHERGFAKSVEAWRSERLVGGLYGIALRGAFFGESMFCRPDLGGTDASKVCLVELVRALRAAGFALLDCQYSNPHTLSLGGVEIALDEYLARLRCALKLAPRALP